MKNDFIDPLEAYVESIRTEIIEVTVDIPTAQLSAEPSLMGLSPEKEEEAIFTRLQNSVDGRYWCIGDQVSKHTAWMESAIQSAHVALADLDARVRAEATA